MKDLLEKKDDSIIQLDINEFLNRQKYICKKFKNPYMDDPNEIKLIDSFILHIIEEANEFYFFKDLCLREKYFSMNEKEFEEFKNSANLYKNEDILCSKIEELIDVIMYLGSFLCSLINYYENFSLYIPSHIKNIIYSSSKVNLIMFHNYDFDFNIYSRNFLKDFLSKTLITDIRRKYPERKYHKVYKALTEKEKNDRINHVLETIYNSILVLFNYLVYITVEKPSMIFNKETITLEKLNTIINDKENFITNYKF